MMKNFLIKSISILTAFAMVFSSQTVWAVDVEQPLAVEEAGDEFPEIFVNMNHGYCISLLADEHYNFMGTVGAIDPEDGNITESVIVDSSAVTFGIPGDYEVAYSVTDSFGNKTVVIKTFTVGECHEEPTTDEEILVPAGDIVVPEETCPVIYARVNFSEIADGAQADGWRNWVPGGDLGPQVFVGAADAQYDDEEWFPLTEADGTTVLTDVDVSSYADVPGLAIERQDGKIRLVLYGFHNEENGELGGKEYAAGVLELQGATWDPGMQSPLDWGNDITNPRIHDPAINDSVHPMESRGDFPGTIDQYDYRFDRMRTISPTKVSFTLVATAGADGFYASYDIPDCGEEEPPCEDCNPVVIFGCTDDAALNYDPEATEDDQSCQYQDDFEDEGDSENGGGSSSSGSTRRSSGGSVQGASIGPGGEVLGACVQFTEYHRKGDQGGEVARIQEFLNQEMNAGLVVDGYYGEATFKAVKDFQQKYFKEIITPWSPPLPLRVTGKWYKTTRMMANEITACPEAEVFLEDPAVMYKVKWAPAT